MKHTTIFQALAQKIAKEKPEVPVLTPKISEELENAFVKCALDQGCEYSEISCMISDLNKGAAAGWYETEDKSDRKRAYEKKKQKKLNSFITS